jgi:hypothetical protein
MYYFFCVDDLIKPRDFIWVVRRWCGMRTDPIHECFDNSEGLNNEHLSIQRGP